MVSSRLPWSPDAAEWGNGQGSGSYLVDEESLPRELCNTLCCQRRSECFKLSGSTRYLLSISCFLRQFVLAGVASVWPRSGAAVNVDKRTGKKSTKSFANMLIRGRSGVGLGSGGRLGWRLESLHWRALRSPFNWTRTCQRRRRACCRRSSICVRRVQKGVQMTNRSTAEHNLVTHMYHDD